MEIVRANTILNSDVMRIPQIDIDRVLDATNIEDVIQDIVKLRREGSRFKACCPFHSEDTPSFVVTPKMNIYKCFGCGESGNAVSFLMKHEGMTFVDAIKYLAKRAGIMLHTDDTPLTSEEQEKYRKIEAAKIVNAAITDFFAEQLYADNDMAKQALAYAMERWPERQLKFAKIGWAPGHGAIRKWARDNGYSTELLLELGLLRKNDKGQIYDGFNNRIIMPIYSRSNQVLGFTARCLGDEKPKYLNSPESILFHKSDIIFGLNVATREATKEGIIYLVEGAPDVYRLQSIGVTNTVASLGTAWSKKQFETLLKYNPTICFIPDIDDPKPGEQFGPGILSVMKNGQKAIETGLRVIVKEIEPSVPNKKYDADSYIKSKYILDEIPKEDFVIWYANKLIAGKTTAPERAGVMKQVGPILALISDKDYLKIIIKQLCKVIGVTAGLLQSAVNESVKANAQTKQVNGEKMMDRELYSRYGFYENRHCYYSLNKDGIEQRWSNFVLQPLFHIKDQINPKRLYRIINVSGHEEIIELKQEDLVSLQRFKLRVKGLGNYIWEAKEEQLTKLKGFLYEKTETATEITQLGWQKDDFFAFGNGAFYGGQWIAADDFGIVRLQGVGNFYLPASSRIYRAERKLFQFERKFIHSDLSEVSFRTYTDKLIEVFGNNAKVGICFLLATLFKDVVVARTKNFPILNLFGPKGSGKSELGHSLMSFFIINNDPPNLSSATDAALADAVAQCANALVHVDEYKNTIELSRREFIKGLYDGVGRTRMNMDRDKKRETTAVDCGVILSGQEMPTIDIAIFHRMIYLTFDKSEFSHEAKRRFDELKNMRDLGCSHLVLQLLKSRKRVESEFASNYNAALADLETNLTGQSIEDRIFRNWVTPLAIFRTLSGVIDVSFDYREMLKICTDGILRQNGVCKSTNELASFWQVVDFLHLNGDIYIDADYRIKYETEFKGKGLQEKILFKGARAVLYLRTKRVMMLYRKNGKTVGESTLPVESLRHYLEISKEFIGIKNAVRFKNLSNAMESTAPSTAPDGSPSVTKTSTTDWALCFDYQMLVENYGINLEVETAHDDDIDPTYINENDQTRPY